MSFHKKDGNQIEHMQLGSSYCKWQSLVYNVQYTTLGIGLLESD